MCNITMGIVPEYCQQSLPGIQSTKIWAMNFRDITSFAYIEGGAVVSGITLASGKYAYKFDVHKNTASFTGELQSADNSGDYYNETFSFRVIDDSLDTLIASRQLIGTDLVFVAQKKNGNFYILGTTEGLKLGEGTMYESGAAPGDDTGRMFSFDGIAANQAQMFWGGGFYNETMILAYLESLEEPAS
jgi:hypothetical protein